MSTSRVAAGPLASTQFRAIVGTSLVVMLGFGLIIPALPLFAQRFGVGEAGIGLLLMAFAVTRLAGNIWTGSLIHRLGERRISFWGLAIVGVSSLAAGLAGSYAQLVIFRGLGGIGSAFFFGGIMSHLIATVPADARGRSMGIFQSSIAIGLLVGPAVGGALIARFDERVPLLIYGVMCLACAPLISTSLRKDWARTHRAGDSEVESTGDIAVDAYADEASLEGAAPPPRGMPARAALRPLFADRAYVAALACGGLTFLQTSALQTLMALYWVKELGQPKGSVGLPFAANALAGLTVLYHAGSLSDRRGRKFALIPGLAILAMTFGGLGFASTGVAVLALMVVNGFAAGYMRPNPSSMVADIATHEQRAVAVAGYRVSGDVGSLLGPIIAGTIAEVWGYRAAFLAIAVVTTLVLTLAASARETRPAVA